MKDYEPTIDYQHRLKQISRVVGNDDALSAKSIGKRGIWISLLEQKQKRDTLSLTRTLTDREAAQHLDSPRGLMLHGEVGTGKSMLVDLFADCLPTRKKRRWHFNTFMLDTFARLERLRHVASTKTQDEHPLLVLARDMIQTSPVLFLDEFQLPDRASSKIMTNLMTSFFQLGGVLIATSNRMPDELAKAAGVEFAPPPSRMLSLGQRLGLGGVVGKSEQMFAGKGEFTDFLELLKSRCDVWEMEGKMDYRRRESQEETTAHAPKPDLSVIDAMRISGSVAPSASSRDLPADEGTETPTIVPRMFHIKPPLGASTSDGEFLIKFSHAQHVAASIPLPDSPIPWVPTTLRVYGRNLLVPRHYNGTIMYTFDELCATRLGSADYITLASTFHTLILTDVPVLTTLQKNEARRFIILLDALYEAKCKLLISAEAGPDDLFFPEQTAPLASENASEEQDQDATYAETFSEAYQDATAPFRPNISSYEGDGVDRTHARLQGILAPDALEDDPPNRIRRVSPFFAPSDNESEVSGGAHEHFETTRREMDFARSSTFVGEDEKFAYKRARSRLWEMCGARWWARDEEDWWRPVPVEVRRWEKSATAEAAPQPPMKRAVEEESGGDLAAGEGMGDSRAVDEVNDQLLYQHKMNPVSRSPFRTHAEPPPNISSTHVWGVMKWGKKAGAWGKGPEGLEERKRARDDGNQEGPKNT